MPRLSENAIIARKALDITINEPELAKQVANVFNRAKNEYITVEEILKWDLYEEEKRKMYEDILLGWMKGWELE